MDSSPQWVVTEISRREDGHLDVTYSLASGIRYVAVVIPGTDSALAIHKAGEHLQAIYQTQGYL